MRFALLFSILVFSACPPPTPATPPLELSEPSWTLAGADGGTLTYKRGEDVLIALPPDAFQVGVVSRLEDNQSYDPYWLVVNDGVFTPTLPMGFAWRAPTEASVRKEGDELVLSLTYTRSLTATVRATKQADGHVMLRFVPEGTATIGYLRVRATVDKDEAFYGLGEWFDSANHRGKLRPMQLEPDLNVESAATENHVSVPFLVGSRGWGMFVESHRHGLFDVAKSDPTIIDTMWGTAEASADGLTVHLFSDEDPLNVPRQYYSVTGFPRPPADWATGPWIWRDESRDQAEIEDDVRQIRALDLPTSGIWIDRPYATEVNTFDFNPTGYPDAGGMISNIHNAGLKLALWHTPYLAPAAQPMRAEAEQNNYFPPGQGTMLNRWSAPLDFTRPEAVTFWSGLITRYTSAGVEGFKLDFAEDVVAGISGRIGGWTFANGETSRTMTDKYPRLYHDVYRSVLGSNDGFMLVRHARWGEQTTGVIVWPGDIDATLTRFGEHFTERGGDEVIGVGGLPSAIRAGVGLSMSGFPYFAADTGGYRHSPPDKETWIRWVEQSALMPVMQTGDSSSQPPWVYTPENGRDAQALKAYRDYSRLHLRLFPFFWSYVKAMAVTGKPVVRPFGLQFPELGLHPEDQYMLGESLLVAPVETAGATKRTVIKPPGHWYSWWDGAELVAPMMAVQIDAPLTTLPLFIRAGALIPMLSPTIDTLAPSTDPGVESFAANAGTLWVRVQPGGDATFTVFDGTALTQRDGRLTAIAGSRFNTSIIWEARGVGRPGLVTHAGATLTESATLDSVTSGFSFDNGVLLIKTPLDGQGTTFD